MKAKLQKKGSRQTGARERGRVLLISDQPGVIYKAPLEAAGLEVVGVCAGAAALVSLQRSRPHLVIAATPIKGISVRELARMLDRMQDGIPLIFVGAEDANLDRRYQAISAGAVDYFQIPSELQLLCLRAAQMVGLSQTMERLHAEADLDPLTGLANRRRFRTALNRELERWRRYSVPCALLLLDIDHMKEINDCFGHPAGDAVIRYIAKTLDEVSRDNDTAARVGGEEFTLLLANVAEEKAAGAAERLRAALAEHGVEGVGKISVSIGVASCPAHANTERTLYAASDRALYIAKNEGRNRVAIAPLMQENLPGL